MGTYGTIFAKARELANEGKPLDQAMREAWRFFYSSAPVVHIDAEGNRIPVANPTGAQMQQALNNYLPTMNKMARYTAPVFSPAIMEQRYAYSVECMEAMQTIIKEHVQRAVIFDETAKRLFGDDFGDQIRDKVHPRRWFEQLMQAGDTPEAKAHNELVVSLVMLGEAYARNDRETGNALFRKARLNYYENTAGLDHDAAVREVTREESEGLQRLVVLTEEAMAHNPTLEQADAARDAILSGAARNEPGGLERAYRTIMNPGSGIAWNISNACDDFASFGLNIDKSRFRHYEMNSTATHDCVVQHVANPFYAILDAADLINAGASGLPKRKGEPDQFNAVQSYGGDLFNGLYQARKDFMAKSALRFGMTEKNGGGVRNQPNDIDIFTDRKGRTVILVGDPIGDLSEGLIFNAHTDIPGRLFNGSDYSGSVKDLIKESTAHDNFMRSSGQYRDLKRALGAIPKEIPDQLTVEETNELERKFTELKRAAEAYLKRKDDQFKDRGTREGKDPYEKARYAFGRHALDFAEEMIPRAKFVREHIQTMEQVLAVEAENVQNPIPGDENLPPYARKLKNEQDERERKEREAKEEQERTEKQERIVAGTTLDLAMDQMNNAMNESSMSESSEELIGGRAITDAEKNLKNDDMPVEGELLELFTLEAKQAYADALEAGDDVRIKACAADVLAASAAKEFIEQCKKTDPDLADRFLEAADSGEISRNAEGYVTVVGGKVRDLVDGIKMTPKFEELLSKAAPADPEKFGKALPKTAVTVGKTAVLSVQEAQRQREDLEREQANLDALDRVIPRNNSISSIEAMGGNEFDRSSNVESQSFLKEGNSPAKIDLKAPAAGGQPNGGEKQKIKEQPKVKGGPNI